MLFKTSRRVTFLAALIGVFSLSTAFADYYIADTGRSEKKNVQIPAGDVSTSSPVAAAGGEDAAGAAPIVEVPPDQLYFPAVEKALKATGIDRIAVQSEGVAMTLRTFAEIQVDAITGKSKFNKQDPVYTVLGMIYQNQLWVRCPVIPVEHPKLAEALGLDPGKHNRVSPVWIMKTPRARTLVMEAMQGQNVFASQLDENAKKALKKLSFRMASFLGLPGEFKIVPLKNAQGAWLAPTHLQSPGNLDNEELARQVGAVEKSAEPFSSALALDEALRKAYYEQKTEGIAAASGKLLGALDSSPDYLSTKLRGLDYWQTTFKPFQKSAMVYFFAFLAFVAYLLTCRKKGLPNAGGTGNPNQDWKDGRAGEYSRSPVPEEAPVAAAPHGINALAAVLQPETQPALAGGGIMVSDTGADYQNASAATAYGDPILQMELETVRGSRIAWSIAYLLMTGAAVLLVIALVNRFLLGGRMPVSNMYESITFAMGAFSVVALAFEGLYRRGWVGVGACFFGWTLMVAANSMPLYNRKIEPLVAVLNSVWLNFHVTSLLISYSCFLLAFVFGIFYFIKDLTGNRPGMLPRAETFEYLTYRCVQVGWPLLTLGIFLGAVWANTAWGSYWSWDPKETWALITWLTYTVYLHLRINLGWTGRRSIVASMIGFAMMLLTYFGVSYLPGLAGGMHSYAEPISR